jgi:hypothetical protein
MAARGARSRSAFVGDGGQSGSTRVLTVALTSRWPPAVLAAALNFGSGRRGGRRGCRMGTPFPAPEFSGLPSPAGGPETSSLHPRRDGRGPVLVPVRRVVPGGGPCERTSRWPSAPRRRCGGRVLSAVASWLEWTASVPAVRRLRSARRRGAPGGLQQPRLPATVWTVADLVAGERFTWTADGPGVRTRRRWRRGCLAGWRCWGGRGRGRPSWPARRPRTRR